MISLSQTETSGGLRVSIETIHPTGSQTILLVRSATRPYTLLQSGFVRARAGDAAWLSFDAAAFSFFDPTSRRRIGP